MRIQTSLTALAVLLSTPAAAQVAGGVRVENDVATSIDGSVSGAEITRDIREDVETAARATRTEPRVNAGARISRNERCWDGTRTYDPYFRDGAYYCESSIGGSAAAAADAQADADQDQGD